MHLSGKDRRFTIEDHLFSIIIVVIVTSWSVGVCVAAIDSEADKPSSSAASDVMAAAPQVELYAVLDTGQTKRPKTPLPVSGPELAARLKIGTRVVRGIDWKWGDQVQLIIDHYYCKKLSSLQCLLRTTSAISQV